MSLAQMHLSCLLIREHFGETVAKVCTALRGGAQTIALIVSTTQIPIAKVKQSLALLIKYGFVSFEKGLVSNIAEYTLVPAKICLLLRYPKYITLAEEKFCKESALLVEELLRYGFDTMTNVILRVKRRIETESSSLNNDLCYLRDKFHILVQAQYFIRCPHPLPTEGTNEVPTFSVTDTEVFLPVEINMKCLLMMSQGASQEDPGDKGICWRLNFDRFHQDMRDDLITSAIARRLDPDAAKLISHLLHLTYLRTDPWATQSNGIPMTEIKDAIHKVMDNPHLTQYYDQYLKIIEDTTGFVTRREGSSGMVEVNMSKFIQTLTYNSIANAVEQRFGPKAARIFRLVQSRDFIEQEQIQQLAMMPDKESKLLTYQLLQEKFLQIQELKKPAVTSAPNKTFFLFRVDLNQVVKLLLDKCYKSLANSITRRTFGKSQNIKVIEKRDRIESLAESMREHGSKEEEIQQLVNDWLTPPDRIILDSVEAMIKKLNIAELQVDETVFLLDLFTFYQKAIFRTNKINKK